MKLRTLATLSALFLTACGRQQPDEKAKAESGPPPEVYRVNLDTTKGAIVVEVTRAWAPRGADRFYELVQKKFYDGGRFYRVVPRFVVQFGLKGDPATDRTWSQISIPDDPVKQNNVRGTLSFAMAGMGFAPFAKVVSGMEVVEQLYKFYGDAPPSGVGPEQSRIREEGNEYLERYFPRLDYIKTATVVTSSSKP
jgi:peptidyl-prolyl cis-trans isomerase A (cyclophilin A)